MENVHGISASANKVLAVEQKIRTTQSEIEEWVRDAEVSARVTQENDQEQNL